MLGDGQLERVVRQEVLEGKEDGVGRALLERGRELLHIDGHTANARLRLLQEKKHEASIRKKRKEIRKEEKNACH